MKPYRPGAVPVVLTLLLAAASASADPPAKTPPSDPARRASALNDEASALYERGQYHAAVEKLEQAVALDPKGKELLYNLAVIHEKMGQLAEAATYYRRQLDLETDPHERSRLQGILRRIEGARGDLAPAPGPRAPAAPALKSEPRPIRPAVWVTGATAGLAFVLGSVFAITAAARNPGSGARTGGGTTITDIEESARAAHTFAVAADVSYAIAIGAAGAATVLFLTTPRGAPASAAVGPGGVQVSF